MKKRILPLLLCLILVLCALSACDQVLPPELQANADGFYEIDSPDGLLSVAHYPEGNYILKADLDMTGIQWTPIEGFSGKFEGKGHTISNLTISATAEKRVNLGLFGSIDPNGSVSDLNLVNVTVQASDTNAQNVGTIAGKVAGKVNKCSATGAIFDTRADANGVDIAVGALVGRADSTAIIAGSKKLSVSDDAGIYTTDGLAADVNLCVVDGAKVFRGLVGIVSEGSEISGLWRDSFYGSRNLSDEMKQRQEKAVAYMYKCGSTEWTVSQELTHTAANSPMHAQTFVPGETYAGMVYNHTASSYARFKYALNEDGSVKSEIEALGSSDWDLGGSANGSGFTTYMGTDCSGAVAWGWMQISPNQVLPLEDGEYQGGAFVLLSNNMIPVPNTQENYGIFPVGHYNSETHTIDQPAYTVDAGMNNTINICNANGATTMYEAYAMARKADAVLYGEPGGHVRMLAADPVVIRDADGTIDPELSYMITHEQGDGLFNRKWAGGNSSWRLHYRYTFSVLLNGSAQSGVAGMLEAGSGKGYLPITIRALRDETVKAPTIYPSASKPIVSPMSGVVQSNFRIESTTVVVKNSSGQEVYNKEAFTGLTGDSLSFRFYNTSVDLKDYHSGAMTGLPSGNYTFTVTVLLSDGTVFTVAENQAYTHTAS